MSERSVGPLYVAEPGGMWLQREPVVVDCSVLAATLWGEPAGQQAASLLVGKSLHAPHLLVHELANVARNKSRAGASESEVRAGLETFGDLVVVLHGSPATAVWELAHRYQLTAYDAAYLLLAATLQAPLLTFDQRLSQAAQKHLSGGERS